jgi:pimeloyl-ACP methyl ester carboxylesterase
MQQVPGEVMQQMKDLCVFTTGDGCRMAYRWDGPAGKPVPVLSNSIGTTLDMWNLQIPQLSKHFRVLRYDHRNFGRVKNVFERVGVLIFSMSLR